MKIQPINLLSKPNRPCFSQQKRRTNVDRAVTVADLYEFEDRIDAKNKAFLKLQKNLLEDMEQRMNHFNETIVINQNKMIGHTLEDMTKLIYFRPLASSHDHYKTAVESTKVLANNGI